MKCIQVTNEVWKELKKRKIEQGENRITDVIEKLIEKEKQEN